MIIPNYHSKGYNVIIFSRLDDTHERGRNSDRALFDTLTMNAGNWNMDDEIVTNMRNPAIGLMCDNALGEDVIDPLYSLENVDLWGICIGIHSSASSLLG